MTATKPTPKKMKPVKIIIIVTIVIAVVITGVVTAIIFGVNAILKNSDSYHAAISYIENSDEIIEIVGDIDGYGFFTLGNISYINGSGDASFTIKIIGSERTLRVGVELEKEVGQPWQVVKIAYRVGG